MLQEQKNNDKEHIVIVLWENSLFLTSPEVFRIPWCQIFYENQKGRRQKDRYLFHLRIMKNFEHSLPSHLGAQCSFANHG